MIKVRAWLRSYRFLSCHGAPVAQTQLEEPLAWSKEWVPCLLETVQLLYRPEMVYKALISTLEELTWSPILFEELL